MLAGHWKKACQGAQVSWNILEGTEQFVLVCKFSHPLPSIVACGQLQPGGGSTPQVDGTYKQSVVLWVEGSAACAWLGGFPLGGWPDAPSSELSEIKQCTSTKDNQAMGYRWESRLEGSQH